MPFTLPDKGEGLSDLQSLLFQEYLEVEHAAILGTDCVLQGGDLSYAGCLVTPQGSPNMTVAVATGEVQSNGVWFSVTGANATISAADATNPRLDLIVVDSAGAIQTRTGTAAAFSTSSTPKPPNRTANDVVLAVVYVAANAASIVGAAITDLRCFGPRRGLAAAMLTQMSAWNPFGTWYGW